jgi:hypothetical protein
MIGFRLDDYSVVIQDRKMTIINADSEEKAQAVINHLTAVYERA